MGSEKVQVNLFISHYGQMDQLSAEEIQAELKRYYEGDPKARPPQHLYRLIRSEDVPVVLGPDNWAVARQRMRM